VLIDSNGQLGTISSSRRYKEDIQPIGDVSASLLKLRPVTYAFDKTRAALIVFVSIALIADASAGAHPSSAQGLRGPIGASAAVSRIITASVVVWITIVDIAWTDMRRIMTAAEVVGPIIGLIARSYRQVRPWAAATMLDLNHIIPGAFAGLQKGLPGRCGLGLWGKAP
jgi:Chaperone of endosialidase